MTASISVIEQSLTTKDDRGLETGSRPMVFPLRISVLNQQGISRLHVPLGPTIEATVSNRSVLC